MVFSDTFINISFLRLNLATVPIVWYCFVSFYFLGWRNYFICLFSVNRNKCVQRYLMVILFYFYKWFSTRITLYIFLFDQVVVLNEVHTLVKLVRYTVSNIPIRWTSWRRWPQQLGDLRPRCIILTLLLDFHKYAVITYCTFQATLQ